MRRRYFTEHCYDALGRRVLVRTRRDGLCYKATSTIADCTGGIARYVWAGDNLLWEMRGPGADSVAGARLNEISADAQEFGVIGYTHAGGIDRPLVVWKGQGSAPTTVVVPHANWRGLFGKGTTSSGGTSTVPIEWPGFKTTAYHRMGPGQQTTTNWMGSLIGGQRDPGGTMYMRNRYYDPQTGQFTQKDPIGIAGGLNVYGFAAGDPVGNWDPFGTCAWGIGPDAAFGRCTGNEPEDDQQQPGRPGRRGSGSSFRGGSRSALPGGSLAASERRGGHTLSRHVNVSRDFIVRRAQRPGGPSTASRFYDLATAENAVAAAIRANQIRIEQWLAPGGGTNDLPIRT